MTGTDADAAITAANSAGFPAPAGITADPVVLAPLAGRLHVLLTMRPDRPQHGFWSLPGGFVSPSERPAETAQRKLTEKTGMGAVYFEQLQSYADPGRDPRGWIASISYLALIDAAVLADGSAGRWTPAEALPPLAFDHAQIVTDAVDRLRGKLWYSNIVMGLLPERFTMPQARRVFAEISGVAYEPSNFRRELENSGLVRTTGEVVKGVPGRPAVLYEFVDRKPAWSLRRSRHPARLRVQADEVPAS